MILAYNKLDIPEQWFHNPDITNKNNETVALIYSK